MTKLDTLTTVTDFRCEACLPDEGVWVGRVWLPSPAALRASPGRTSFALPTAMYSI